jgi:HK97 family phage major capsid protein
MLLADAKDRLEETGFAVGTGTLQPWGIVPRATILSGGAGSVASGVTAPMVYALQAALPARWRGANNRPTWLANLITLNKLRNTPKFTGSTESLLQDLPDGSMRMLGKPVYESTSIVGTQVNLDKVLVYADMSQYYIVDRVGMSVVYDPIVLGANRRPTGQGAWYAFWRTGADVSTSLADRVLQLVT